MTRLRQMMLDELQRRNYAATTTEYYLRTLERFARYFRRPPDQLTQYHIRTYQTYLLRDRKLHPHSVRREIAALRCRLGLVATFSLGYCSSLDLVER